MGGDLPAFGHDAVGESAAQVGGQSAAAPGVVFEDRVERQRVERCFVWVHGSSWSLMVALDCLPAAATATLQAGILLDSPL
jgi:hypothetical protein